MHSSDFLGQTSSQGHTICHATGHIGHRAAGPTVECIQMQTQQMSQVTLGHTVCQRAFMSHTHTLQHPPWLLGHANCTYTAVAALLCTLSGPNEKKRRLNTKSKGCPPCQQSTSKLYQDQHIMMPNPPKEEGDPAGRHRCG